MGESHVTGLGNGCKWLDMARIAVNVWKGWKWLERAGNGWKWLEMAGNGWKWVEWAEIAKMGENGLICPEWLEIAGKGQEWLKVCWKWLE